MGYDILALATRENKDERTLGNLFYDYGRPMPDIEVAKALNCLLETIIGLGKKFAMEAGVLDAIFDEFKKPY